jgi:hypothetical protein
MASGTLNSPASGGEAEGVRRSERSEYDPYILDRIQKTRRQVKRIELLTALLGFGAAALAYSLLFVLLDHWLVPGGLGVVGRATAWVILLGASISFLILRVLPIWLGRVNPIYAAMAIEQSEPSLKNSLVNFLLLRGHREEIAPAIYKGILQRAAADLSQVNVDTAIDRSRVVRIAYVLLALVVIACFYKIASPKDPLTSVGRLLAPWARWQAPTRVSIREIEPGNIQTFLDDSVRVSAFVRGLSGSDEAVLYYSTADGQVVDQPIPMQLPHDKYRHEAMLPAGASGLQQSVEYYLKAGDATSQRYRIEVVSAPAILIEKVEYDYPDYLGVANRMVERQGDLRAIEGTKVNITARTNVPVQGAYLDFSCDGRRDLSMSVAEQLATCSFTLTLNAEGRAEHATYQLRFTTEDGRENPQPIQHRIEIVADQAPLVEIVTPTEDPTSLAVNGVTTISIRAEDADFALRNVTLLAERGGEHLLKESLLSTPHGGEFRHGFVLDARELGLKPGEEILYWAEARDVKQPQANMTATVKRRLQVSATVTPEEQAQQKQASEQQKEEFEDQTTEPPQPSPDATPVEDPTPASPDAPEPPKDDASTADQGEEAAQEESAQRVDPESNPGDAFEQIMKFREERQAADENPREDAEETQQPQSPADQQEQQGEDGAGDSAQNQSSQKNKSQNASDQPTGQPDQPSPSDKPESGGKEGAGEQEKEGESTSKKQSSDAESGESAGLKQEPPRGPNRKQQNSEEGQESGNSTPDEQKPSPSKQKEEGGSQDSQSKPSPQSKEPREQGKPSEQSPEQQQQQQQQQQEKQKQEGEQNPGEQKQPQGGGAGEQPSGETGESGEKPQSGGESGSDDASGTEEQGGEEGSGGSQPSDDSEASSSEQDGASGSEAGGQEGSKPKPGKGAQQADDGGRGAGEGEAQPADAEAAKTDQQGEQSPSGGDPERPNNSAGQGQSSGEQPSPSPAPQRQAKDKAKQSQGGESPSEPMGESATSPSISQSDSDAQSSERGDRSGQGEEGGGQRASQPGKGAPGENSAAEEGSGEAEGAGEGPTGSDGGSGPDKGKAEGQPKGQAEGEGRNAAEGSNAGGKPNSPSNGKPGQDDGSSNSPTGAGSGEGSAEAGSGDGGGAGNTPADGSAAGATGNSQSKESPARQVARPTGSGGERSDKDPSDTVTSPEREDQANLDYARQATDLVLDFLKDQSDRGAVDQELLDRLGWSEDDLARFMRRWEELRQAAKQPGDRGKEGEKKLEEALQGLGLTPGSRSLKARTVDEEQAQELQAGRRSTAPAEYAEQFRAYTQGTARGTKKPTPRPSTAPR